MPGPGLDLVGEEELAEVTEVIASRQLSRYGPDDGTFPAKVRRFEATVAELAGTRYALALNSGTSGLLVAFAALDIGPGDEVIVPGFTYVASISAIVYSGATPVLAEVDRSFDLDPADVEARITSRTRAILLVHMLGNPGRLAEIMAIAERHGLALIEDCRPGLRRHLRRSLGGHPWPRRHVQLQRVQDDHLRRRRHGRHR